MKKRIAVITTGGTIGSILGEDSVAVEGSESRIRQEIKTAQRRLGYQIDTYSALNKNSEDFLPADWESVLQCCFEVDQKGYDGIVITHGTDTLTFTASALLSVSDLWKTKICMTGSYYSPDQPFSDASLNILAALQFVAADHPSRGVFVAFRKNTNNSEAIIMDALSVKPMAFDNYRFEATYDDIICDFSPNSGLNHNIALQSSSHPSLKVTTPIGNTSLTSASEKAGLFTIHPGMNFDIFSKISDDYDALVFDLYHCGTAASSNFENSALLKLLAKRQEGNQLSVLSCIPSRYIPKPYLSSLNIAKSGAIVLKDIQAHFAFTYIILAISHGRELNLVAKDFLRYSIRP